MLGRDTSRQSPAITTPLSEAQPVISTDAEFIARLVAEVAPWGAASTLRVTRSEDAPHVSINQTHLDPLAFGGVRNELVTGSV